jgi:hypothetical protein
VIKGSISAAEERELTKERVHSPEDAHVAYTKLVKALVLQFRVRANIDNVV